MPKTLLLVDDSVTIQRVIELTFTHEDVRVVSVGDGQRALQWLDTEMPDIVLVDVGVPGVDGYALASQIKTSPRLGHVPVLLLAGAFEPVDRSRIAEIGCEGVLVKPFEPQHLVSRVHELLARAVSSELVPNGASRAAVPADAPHRTATRRPADESRTVTPFPAPPLRPVDPPRVSHPFAESTAEPRTDHVDGPTSSVWELGLPEPLAAAPPPAPVTAPPPPAPVPSVAPSPGPGRVSLASAFTALLAAEQAAPMPAGPSLSPLTEATIEDAVRRVLARMTDDLVRRIVIDTAERLIREEIERIKSTPE